MTVTPAQIRAITGLLRQQGVDRDAVAAVRDALVTLGADLPDDQRMRIAIEHSDRHTKARHEATLGVLESLRQQVIARGIQALLDVPDEEWNDALAEVQREGQGDA